MIQVIDLSSCGHRYSIRPFWADVNSFERREAVAQKIFCIALVVPADLPSR